MSRGSLRRSFTPWGFRQEQTWVTLGLAWALTGRISPACGSSWRSRTSNNRVSSPRMLREGSRFWRCFLPLGPEQSLPGMQTQPISRTAGVKFRERIILSGSSRGLSRRRRKSEKFGESGTTKTMNERQQITRARCTWAQSELNIPYHDVFDGFDPEKVARYDKKKVRELLRDAGIIRNRLKIDATIGNARAFLEVQKEFGTFDAYIWRFVGGQPKQNAWKAHKRLPAKTPESDALSKDLRKRGFRFVGSTICYALMQATGLVNDHLVSCFRYAVLRS